MKKVLQATRKDISLSQKKNLPITSNEYADERNTR